MRVLGELGRCPRSEFGNGLVELEVVRFELLLFVLGGVDIVAVALHAGCSVGVIDVGVGCGGKLLYCGLGVAEQGTNLAGGGLPFGLVNNLAKIVHAVPERFEFLTEV